MAHHSNEESWKEADFDNGFKFRQPSDFKQPNLSSMLGATGNFPEGKLNEQDEGELQFGIGVQDGKVILDFGKSVHWIGFTKQQAKLIGQSLIDRANEIT